MGAALGALLAEALAGVEASARWDYSASTATTFLSTIVGAMAALTGFVITVTVLVVQTAIGTFSARYLRLWYRDRMLKATLAETERILSTRTVVGEPINVEGQTIIPLVAVGFGFGAGGGSGKDPKTARLEALGAGSGAGGGAGGTGVSWT